MATYVNWFGKDFVFYTRGQLIAALDAWRVALVRESRKAANVKTAIGKARKGSARYLKELAQAKEKFASGKHKQFRKPSPYRKRYDRSVPGEPPRRVTGRGRKSIVGGRKGLEARVGYDTSVAKHMLYHELGIRYKNVGYQQRPTITLTMQKSQALIIAEMRRAIKKKKTLGQRVKSLASRALLKFSKHE